MGGKNHPNILFIMTDQQRYDCMGANGNSVIKTPGIDRLAETGANFSSFFIQAPVCVPSRQTFFSGRYPRCHKNRVNYTAMDNDVKLMQKYLQAEGYRTAFVGKLHYYPPTNDYALSTGFDYGLLHDAGPTDSQSDYVKWLRGKGINGDYRAVKKDAENPHTAILPDEYHETTWCGEQTRSMLEKLAGEDGPFFLFSSYWKPHSSFEVPEPWASMYNRDDIELPPRVTEDFINRLAPPVRELALRISLRHYELDDETRMWEYRAYYGAVSQIDREVGLTLECLDDLGLSDDTIVIFTSDHGDVMGERGMVDKNTFYDSAIHVPFIIKQPGKIMPGTYSDLTESTDVLSTLFDLCGLETPYCNQGRSFAGLLTGGAAGPVYSDRDYVFAENIIPEVITSGGHDSFFVKGKGVRGILHPDAKMVRSRKWKYNYYVDYEELFDLENDPWEMTNLACSTEHAEVKRLHKEELLKWLVTSDEADQIAPYWYSVKNAEGEWTIDKYS